MNDWGVVLYGLAGFGMAYVSGIAGAGGGFVMTPLGVLLGLSPAQAVSTGKFSGLAITVSSLIGMKRVHGRVSKRRVIPVMVLAFVIGLLAPLAIMALDQRAYRVIIGILLLLMIPVMVLKKIGVKSTHPKLWQRIAGGGLLAFALTLQGVFSGGLGTLVNVVLMGMLGMTATEAAITKRWSQLVLNTTIILGVLGAGLIVWKVVIVSVITASAGGYLGGRVAVTKGDGLMIKLLIGLMFIAAIMLIMGA